MATSLLKRHLPAAALLIGLLLLPACGNQSDEEITQLRASLQGWQARYQSLSDQKTHADRTAADQKTRADALSAERDDLKDKFAAAQDQVSRLKAQVSELKETSAQLAASPAPPSAAGGPARADISRAVARLEGVAADLYREGNYNAVNAVLLSACDIGAKDPVTYYRLGYATASAGKYADAAGWYEKAIAALSAQKDPDADLQAKCLNNYGVALSRTGKAPAAIAAYTKAIATEPAYTPALYNLALLYAPNTADRDKAIDALRKYIANGGARSVSARDMLQKLLPPAPAPGATPPAE